MSALDAALSELATQANALSKRSLVGLFWAFSSALLPEFQEWALRRDERTEATLRAALAAAHRFATSNVVPANGGQLLESLELSAPTGDSPDEVPSTSAQDCWICADTSIRVLVDFHFDAGPAIEYALEPILIATTEELFGVSQVGSGDEEDAHLQAIMTHPAVRAAIDFCRWATEILKERPSPTDDDLALVASRAQVLLP